MKSEIRNLWKNKPDYSIISFKSKKYFLYYQGKRIIKNIFIKVGARE